jgi:hypothetical protein
MCGTTTGLRFDTPTEKSAPSALRRALLCSSTNDHVNVDAASAAVEQSIGY